MKKKKLLIPLLVILGLTALYVSGPSPAPPSYDNSWPVLDIPVQHLDEYLRKKEAGLPIKDDNQSRIIWAVPGRKAPTEWAMLYLHGFSASWFEGAPLHTDMASQFHMNLYIPRLAHHGLRDQEPLFHLTAESLYMSALEALSLTHKLGRKVIVMGTSTGATLGIMLAARFPDKVHALMLYSPNIRINDPFAWVLARPWGLQVARLVKGGLYNDSGDRDPVVKRYWYTRYRLEGAVALQVLLESAMTDDTFKRVTCPVFMGYYYRDEENQDPVVKVSSMLEMFEKLGTPPRYKLKIAFPGAGVHVIACAYRSKAYRKVADSSGAFLANLLSGRKSLAPGK
ncbi:MAG: alpha/beta hydrolase [Deltaproteobacteria bacterium]|nr:alpha/beta hydrolase [Deltaproteobacteria bacterium]